MTSPGATDREATTRVSPGWLRSDGTLNTAIGVQLATYSLLATSNRSALFRGCPAGLQPGHRCPLLWQWSEHRPQLQLPDAENRNHPGWDDHELIPGDVPLGRPRGDGRWHRPAGQGIVYQYVWPGFWRGTDFFQVSLNGVPLILQPRRRASSGDDDLSGRSGHPAVSRQRGWAASRSTRSTAASHIARTPAGSSSSAIAGQPGR